MGDPRTAFGETLAERIQLEDQVIRAMGGRIIIPLLE